MAAGTDLKVEVDPVAVARFQLGNDSIDQVSTV
jgi:hypothetical protein